MARLHLSRSCQSEVTQKWFLFNHKLFLINVLPFRKDFRLWNIDSPCVCGVEANNVSNIESIFNFPNQNNCIMAFFSPSQDIFMEFFLKHDILGLFFQTKFLYGILPEPRHFYVFFPNQLFSMAFFPYQGLFTFAPGSVCQPGSHLEVWALGGNAARFSLQCS